MKTRYVEADERQRIVGMHNSGCTLTEIVELTGRHHSVVSAILRSSDLERPFKSRDRTPFTPSEVAKLREVGGLGLSAAEIAEHHLPGRSAVSINSKLQAMGFNRSAALSPEKRATVIALRGRGMNIREVAKIVGVGKSTVATVHSVEARPRQKDPLERRIIDGDVCRIYSSNGKYEFLVDAADAGSLPGTSIYGGANGYPVCRVDGRITYLHHIIMGQPPVGRVVDHINGNRKDCRRANLRFATPSQNSQNALRRGVSRTGYQGVQKTAEGYRASIQVGIGVFDTAEEAARAYDEKAREIFGEFAMTNEKRGGAD